MKYKTGISYFTIFPRTKNAGNNQEERLHHETQINRKGWTQHEIPFDRKRHFTFQEKMQRIHTHRAPDNNCNHCNSGRNAAADAEQGPRKSKRDHLHGKPAADRNGVAQLHFRQSGLSAADQRGRRQPAYYSISWNIHGDKTLHGQTKRTLVLSISCTSGTLNRNKRKIL